jgi:hypothetical protein
MDFRLGHDVRHVLDEIQRAELRDRNVGGVGEVRRVAGLHCRRHLAEEVAEGFRIGRRDVELDVVRLREGSHLVPEQLLRFREIFRPVDDGQLAGRPLGQVERRLVFCERRQPAARDQKSGAGGGARKQQLAPAWLLKTHSLGPSR